MLTCKFENGEQTSLRHVTITVLVIKDGKILLGKRRKYKGKPILEFGKWGLLGGFLNRNETSLQAARREVLEESGWEIDDLVLFRINDNPDRPNENNRQSVDMIFFARGIKKIGDFDEEVSELQWFDLEHLPPVDEIAFDHANNIDLYKRYLKERFALPIF